MPYKFVIFLRHYFINILIAVDQLFNALMFGDPDETISSRAGRRWAGGWWCKVIDFIMFWQPNHCETHVESGTGKDDLI